MSKRKKVFNKSLEWSIPMLIGSALTLGFVGCSEASEIESTQCNFLKGLTPYQVEIARKSYLHGKEKDLGYTLVAINWKESKLGLHKVRLQDGKYGSYGVSHIFLDYHTKGWDNWKRNKYAEKLMLNDDFAIQEGLDRMTYWKKHKKTWFESVAAYNSGWNGGDNYAKDVASIVRQVMKCDFI